MYSHIRLISICLFCALLGACKSQDSLTGVGFAGNQAQSLKQLKALKRQYNIPEMILVQAGTITIPESEGGSGDFSSAVGNYFVSETEITIEQYCEFLNDTARHTKPQVIEDWLTLGQQINKAGSRYIPSNPAMAKAPVAFVGWNGAVAYTNWLTNLVNRYRANNNDFPMPNYRLLIEVEWFCAANQAKADNRLKGFDNGIAEWCHNSFSSSLQNAEIERTQAKGRGIVPPKPEKTVRVGLGESASKASNKYRMPLLPKEKLPTVGFRVGMTDLSSIETQNK